MEAGWEIGNKGIQLDSTVHFNIAEFLAVQGRNKDALDQLEMAFEKGYRNLVWIRLNPDINLLSGEARYKELINKYFH
jgi:hypothetical protein